ncbi:MAG: hypothetical protein ACI4N3_04055 [Alphaproteobacteria bacterium]
MINLNNFNELITNNTKENEKILLNIGNFIINNFILHSEISNKNYIISDIEFYISSPHHQIDTDLESGRKIVHCNERQLLQNNFYIHKTGKSYSLIQGAGIDLCFGNNKDTYVGILIREITDTSTNITYHGPQKVLKTLLNLPLFYGEYKQTYIDYATTIESMDIFNTDNLLHITKTENSFKTTLDKRVNVNSNLLYRVRKI